MKMIKHIAIIAFAAMLSLVEAKAEDRDVRARQRDYEERISPSWEERLERIDHDREHEERAEEHEREHRWNDLPTTDDEEYK